MRAFTEKMWCAVITAVAGTITGIQKLTRSHGYLQNIREL